MSVEHPTDLDPPSLKDIDRAIGALQHARSGRGDTAVAIQNAIQALQAHRTEVGRCAVHASAWKKAWAEREEEVKALRLELQHAKKTAGLKTTKEDK